MKDKSRIIGYELTEADFANSTRKMTTTNFAVCTRNNGVTEFRPISQKDLISELNWHRYPNEQNQIIGLA